MNQIEGFGEQQYATIYVGGGSPSSLPLPLLEEVFLFLSRYREAETEWTVESRADQITLPFLELLERVGVNRLSIGVQSLSPKALKALGRAGSRDGILRGLHRISEVWKGVTSFDMIAAIPGIEPSESRADLVEALSFAPDHLSYYPLEVESGTPLADRIAKGGLTPLSSQREEELWEAGKATLEAHGYQRYEIANFSHGESHRGKHNRRYWLMLPYRGAGPSAVSMLPPGCEGVLRQRGPDTLEAYMQPSYSMTDEFITLKEFLFEIFMMGLRCREGVGKERVAKLFRLQIEDFLPGTLKKSLKEGWLTWKKGHLIPTDKGMDLQNEILFMISQELKG